MNDILTIVKNIAGLKPIPQAVHKVMEAVQDQNGNLAKLSEVIACDPILTANVLKAANCAYYARPAKFETVHQAVVFLGSTEVVDLVLMSSVNEKLNRAQKGYDLEKGALWRYSLSSAFLAKEVAKIKGIGASQVVFTASLLKDIGKLILSQYVSDQYEDICKLVYEQGFSFREAEEKVLGIDHAELGALVARAWLFSPKMIDMIKNHHQPLKSKLAPKETAAVYMGDIMCMMLGIGVGADGLAYRFEPEVIELLQITDKQIQHVLAEFGDNMDRMQAFFSL
jgi:putative nucleotidyltransferase with HDIG domain